MAQGPATGDPLDRHVQECQDGRHQGCESGIEVQELGGDLVADRWGRIALIELEVVLEQGNDRPIGDRLVVGDGPGVEHAPRMCQQVPDELVTQAGFAHAGLANDPHDLPPSLFHMGHQGVQGRQFTGAPDARRQHACSLGTQEAPWRASP
jgi:hypothetical protein